MVSKWCERRASIHSMAENIAKALAPTAARRGNGVLSVILRWDSRPDRACFTVRASLIGVKGSRRWEPWCLTKEKSKPHPNADITCSSSRIPGVVCDVHLCNFSFFEVLRIPGRAESGNCHASHFPKAPKVKGQKSHDT